MGAEKDAHAQGEVWIQIHHAAISPFLDVFPQKVWLVLGTAVQSSFSPRDWDETDLRRRYFFGETSQKRRGEDSIAIYTDHLDTSWLFFWQAIVKYYLQHLVDGGLGFFSDCVRESQATTGIRKGLVLPRPCSSRRPDDCRLVS